MLNAIKNIHMNSYFNKQTQLHPENFNELITWSRRWRISIDELNRAIIDTGSTNTTHLKAHIQRDKISDGWKQLFSNINTLRWPGE